MPVGGRLLTRRYVSEGQEKKRQVAPWVTYWIIQSTAGPLYASGADIKTSNVQKLESWSIRSII